MTEIVINKLTIDKLKKIYDGKKNLGDKPIFITFKADWWGPCRMFGQVLDKVTPHYDGKIDFYKVDVEESQDLAMVFNARSLPTTVMISKEGESVSFLGAQQEDTLKYYFDGLISKK